MRMEARMTRKPGAHRRRLVRVVIAHDQMNVQFGRNAVLDGAQKFQELGGAMAAVRTLSMNKGPVDSLNVFWRCGCKSNARQMHPAAVWLRRAALAI